jgi:hypothetical protein
LQPAAAAYFGELEEALIHGTYTAAGVDPVMIEGDVHTKCKTLPFLHTSISLSPNLNHLVARKACVFASLPTTHTIDR